jgi:hypothetical protein
VVGIVRIIVFPLLMSIGFPVAAQETPDFSQVCVSMSDLAETVMTLRQNGVPMTNAMGLAQGADAAIRDFVVRLVSNAYEVPQFSVEENKQREIMKFQNQVALECNKAIN